MHVHIWMPFLFLLFSLVLPVFFGYFYSFLWFYRFFLVFSTFFFGFTDFLFFTFRQELIRKAAEIYGLTKNCFWSIPPFSVKPKIFGRPTKSGH